MARRKRAQIATMASTRPRRSRVQNQPSNSHKSSSQADPNDPSPQTAGPEPLQAPSSNPPSASIEKPSQASPPSSTQPSSPNEPSSSYSTQAPTITQDILQTRHRVYSRDELSYMSTKMIINRERKARVAAIVQKAFHTTELLEAILLHLPARDLVRALRAQKQFHDVVLGSSKLLRRLFHSPPAQASQILVYEIDSASDKFVPQKSRLSISQDISKLGKAAPFTAMIVEVHPALTPDSGVEHGGRSHFEIRTRIRCRFPSKILKWSSDGSWEEQHLTQPPCKRVLLRCPLDTRTPRKPISWKEESITSPTGVTLGQIRKWLEKIYFRKRELALSGFFDLLDCAENDGEWVKEARRQEAEEKERVAKEAAVKKQKEREAKTKAEEAVSKLTEA